MAWEKRESWYPAQDVAWWTDSTTTSRSTPRPSVPALAEEQATEA
ncbi:MAG: hypothetical protein ACOX14_08175 [Fermentimonas caenicola]